MDDWIKKIYEMRGKDWRIYESRAGAPSETLRALEEITRPDIAQAERDLVEKLSSLDSPDY